MKKIVQTGVGVATHNSVIRDLRGSGLLPIQAQVSGSATYQINGRVSPEAPWRQVRASDTADFLEAISFVPELQVQVTAGTGTVTLWVAEG